MKGNTGVLSRLGFLVIVWMLVSACQHGPPDATGHAVDARSDRPGGRESWPEELRIGYQKSSLLLFVKAQGGLERQLEAHGVAVRWFEFPSGPALLEALNSGKIDFGYAGGAPAVLAQAAPGSQMVYVAFEPEVKRAIVVPRHSAIRDAGDLKGKRVAFVKGSSAHYTLLSALQTVGLSLADIQPVYLQPSEARTAFERGDVDAWAIWDPYLAAAEEEAGARILVDAHTLPRQYGFVLGRRDYVQRYSRIVDVLVQELNAVHRQVQSDPKRAAAQLSAATKLPQAIWQRTLERRAYGISPVNEEVMASQQRIADVFYQSGLLEKTVSVRDAALPFAPPN